MKGYTMQFGVCGDLDMAAAAARASYDYAEWNVGALLKPRESLATFRASRAAVRADALPFPVANGFVPGDLKITGPAVDDAALKLFVTTAMERAEEAGVEVIVFGSGGARRIPDGFDPRSAHEQLVAFCRMVAPVAQTHGVTVVVEPLNRAECNVLTTVDECARLVREVAHPAIRLLVDAYHLMRDDDSCEDIVRHADLLAHVHIATEQNRRAPGAEPCDFARVFEALAKAQYTGRVSIEARIVTPDTELPAALTMMRSLAGSAETPS